jgi:hypothetical protein
MSEEDVMAVQFADKALYEWLVYTIDKESPLVDNDYDEGYLDALLEVREHLEQLWGKSLEPQS